MMSLLFNHVCLVSHEPLAGNEFGRRKTLCQDATQRMPDVHKLYEAHRGGQDGGDFQRFR